MTDAPEVIAERRGAAGVLTLNRPQALNALTLGMVREIAAALDRFEREAGIERIVVKGAGDRAFSAGGDVRWLYDRGQAGDYASQSAFFAEEYRLDIRIKRYPKPYVPLIDGIVMGGGVGVSLHGSHPVAGAKAVFAMPEVGIGFFPDVGGTYLLSRLPHRIGVAMAATGLRANAADMVALGLARAYVPSERLSALAEALERPGDTGAIISEFAAAPPPSPLKAEAATIEAAFADTDLSAIRARLAADGSVFAGKLATMLAAKSPTSLEIALEQMRIGPSLTFEAAMGVEYRIVTRICRAHDFYEGVRATLIDKDNAPAWAARPSRAEIEAYFAPLGSAELDTRGELA